MDGTIFNGKIACTMLAMRNESQITNLSRFFRTGKGQYGEGDLFLGIKVPETRALVKSCWKESTMDDVAELITSPYHEHRLCALLLLVQKFAHARKNPDEQQMYVDFYLSHTEYINNWDLVDLSSYEILGNWLLARPRTVLYDLARNGATLWEQRIAIVTCMQFIRHGEFEDCLQIADILLHHPHDLIHKAVGWHLREVGKRDGELLRNYLRQCREGEDKPRFMTMARTALRYAIEKFPEEERMWYLKPKE